MQSEWQLYEADVFELSKSIEMLECHLNEEVYSRQLCGDHIMFLTAELEAEAKEHHFSLVNMHKTYSAKIYQIASFVHVTPTPMISVCECQGGSMEFLLFENNLSCMDRICCASEELVNRVRLFEADIDDMNRVLMDKECVIRDLNHGVQLLTGEVCSLRGALKEMEGEVCSADVMDASRVVQLQQMRTTVSRHEMKARDLASQLRELE